MRLLAQNDLFLRSSEKIKDAFQKLVLNLTMNNYSSYTIIRVPGAHTICTKGFSLLFLRSLKSFSLGLLQGGLGRASHVEVKGGVLLSDGLDKILLVEVLDDGSCDGTIDLELLAEDGSGDAEDLGNLLEHSLVLLLLEIDGIVKLFLDLDLSPGLLLSLGTL